MEALLGLILGHRPRNTRHRIRSSRDKLQLCSSILVQILSKLSGHQLEGSTSVRITISKILKLDRQISQETLSSGRLGQTSHPQAPLPSSDRKAQLLGLRPLHRQGRLNSGLKEQRQPLFFLIKEGAQLGPQCPNSIHTALPNKPKALLRLVHMAQFQAL